MCVCVYMHTYRQTYRPAGVQTYRHTDRPEGRQAGRHNYIDKYIDTYLHT